jgi:hypothetical protein
MFCETWVINPSLIWEMDLFIYMDLHRTPYSQNILSGRPNLTVALSNRAEKSPCPPRAPGLEFWCQLHRLRTLIVYLPVIKDISAQELVTISLS